MQIGLEPPYLLVKPGVSEEDFYRLADEDSDWEYLDGRIIMHSPASNRHEDLFSFLMTLLRGYLDERGTGIVRGSRYPMRLDAKWSPEPDILVITEARFERLTERRLERPADLVVEIVSESDPTLDYREKLPRYREAGIPEIWFVDRFRKKCFGKHRPSEAIVPKRFRPVACLRVWSRASGSKFPGSGKAIFRRRSPVFVRF
ncbi:MAG TPA: Uma2 family endonuclease [Vicinamibacteria bacterium]|nr:Uma2 family endonuclease [Vicinamibacteria bacterium]